MPGCAEGPVNCCLLAFSVSAFDSAYLWVSLCMQDLSALLAQVTACVCFHYITPDCFASLL